MTNDEWIKAQDQFTPAQRAAVELARSHYLDDALRSWLNAALTFMEGTDRAVEGINHAHGATVAKQDLIAEKVEAGFSGLGAELTAARAEFRDGLSAIGEQVSDQDARLTAIEHEVASFRQSRDASMARHDRNEAKIDNLAAALVRIEEALAAREAGDGST